MNASDGGHVSLMAAILLLFCMSPDVWANSPEVPLKAVDMSYDFYMESTGPAPEIEITMEQFKIYQRMILNQMYVNGQQLKANGDAARDVRQGRAEDEAFQIRFLQQFREDMREANHRQRQLKEIVRHNKRKMRELRYKNKETLALARHRQQETKAKLKEAAANQREKMRTLQDQMKR